MSLDSLLRDLEYDSNRRSLTIRARFPRRGLGGVLVFMALLGALLVFVSIMMGRDRRPDPAARVGFLVFGLVVLVGCGLPALYLFTRWKRVRLEPGRVTIEQGWCFWKSSRRRSLREFAGLRRSARQLGAVSAGSMGMSLAAAAALAAAGAGHAMALGKTVTYHFLELAHARDESLNVILTARPDIGEVTELAQTLSGLYDVPLMGLTRTIFPARASSTAGETASLPPGDTPAANRSASGHGPASPSAQAFTTPAGKAPASQPDLPPPPTGLEVSTDADGITVLLPASHIPMIAGLCLGVPVAALGVAALAFSLAREVWHGLVPIAIGLLLAIIGFLNSGRRARVTLTTSGVSFKMAAMGVRPSFVPWRELRDATIGRMYEGKQALLLSTLAGDVWIAPGANQEQLQWLQRIILVKASHAMSVLAADPRGESSDEYGYDEE